MPDLKFEPWEPLYNIEVAWFEIEKEDVFHMKELYKLIHDWFILNKFVDLEENGENIETYYFQRDLPSGNSEHHIWWRAHKIPKENNYYKYYLKLDYQTLNMGKAEVTHKGVKMKTNMGDVVIRVRSFIMLDYKKEWRNHPILSAFHSYFIKRFYKKQIDFLKEDLWVQTYNLNDVIKDYLKLKTSKEMPKPFHPQGGL